VKTNAWLKFCLLASLVTQTILGQSLAGTEEDKKLLGDDFVFDVQGEITTAGRASTSSGRSSIGLHNSYISLSAAWKDKIRAVVTTKLESIFRENGVGLNDNFSLQEFIKEAYIEVREVGGVPLAIIVGKHPIAFGQNVQAMPLFANNPLAKLQEIKEVYGVTVELTEGLFGLFDKVEISAFETKGGDLELGRIDGVSVRLSKTLTEHWKMTISHAELGNSHLNTGHERRTSVGLIGEALNGDLIGWVEGIYFSNNPQYPRSNFAITGGIMYRVARGTDVMLEYSYIHKALLELGLAIKTNLTKNLQAGVEVRYRNYVERSEHEVIFGISLTYRFGLRESNTYEEYLFGAQNSQGESTDPVVEE